MRIRLLPAAAIVLAAGWLCPCPARSGVVVVANRMAEKIDFAVVQADGGRRQYSVETDDLVPVPAFDKLEIRCKLAGKSHTKRVSPNSIHYFIVHNQKADFAKLSLPSPETGRETPPPAPGNPPPASLAVIPVKLLVDDDEPTVQRIWEKRLRQRIEEASAIFERYCRVRFKVAAVGTWVSNNRIVDFNKAMREFETSVKPAPAAVAIGFTSQYKMPRGRAHLGGTRGPLYSHILIREWSQHVTQTERLEVLVHELGHLLGATHTPEANSVMRPLLGDHRSHAVSFRIGFDPVNTLITYLVGEELRSGRYRGFSRLRPETKAVLRAAYSEMAKVMPEDESTKQYLELLGRPSDKVRHSRSLIQDTRAVVQAISEAARQNHRLPSYSTPGRPSRLGGDRLTELYVRRAAAAAGRLPAQRGAKAFLLGLGIAMDHSTAVRSAPILGSLCRQVETDEYRAERLKVLGMPTMRGRRDLAQHFCLSAALTALLGPRGAETAGVAKELKDSRGGSGFSFVDLSADLAGITFATYVLQAKVSLATLARSFAVDEFLPDHRRLREGIAWKDFVKAYGSANDDRFRRVRTAIGRQITAMPGYRKRQQGQARKE